MPSSRHFDDKRHRPSGVRSSLANYLWISNWRLDTIETETSSLHSHPYCTVSMTAKHSLPRILPQSYSPDAAWFLLPLSCLFPWLSIAFVWSLSPGSKSHRCLRHAFLGCRPGASFERKVNAGLCSTRNCPWTALAWSFGSLTDTSFSSFAVSLSTILSSQHLFWSDRLSPWPSKLTT